MPIEIIQKEDVSLIAEEIKQCLICLRGIKRLSTHDRDEFISATNDVFADFIDKFVTPSLLDEQYSQQDRDNYKANISTIANYCEEQFEKKLDAFGVKHKKVNRNTDSEAQILEIRKGVRKAVAKLGIYHKATGTLQIPALVGAMFAICRRANIEIEFRI